MKRAGYQQEHRPELIFGSILFLLFASLLLALILFSGRGYARISTRMDRNFDERTVISYVANKIRQHDENGAVFIEERDGISMLVLLEAIDGEMYQTMIFCDDGVVRELFTRAGNDVELKSGTEVLAVDRLTFSQKGGTIKVEVSNRGTFHTAAFTLRSNEVDVRGQ